MKFRVGIILVSLIALAACGVKGPPLPPVADDPASSERENRAEAALLPSASPSPSAEPMPAVPTSKKKRSKRSR